MLLPRKWFTPTLVCLCLTQACDSSPTPGAGATRLEQQDSRPGVVFTSSELVIDRLGVPVSAPVTVPSQPSNETMESSDPETVSIHGNGALIAHRAGEAIIRVRPPGRSELRVVVLEARALEAAPSRLELAPRSSAAVVIRGEDGREVPAGSVRWKTAAPDALAVVAGRVHALGRVGTFDLHGEVGESKVVLPVRVVDDGESVLTVTPVRAWMKRGEVVLFRAVGPRGSAMPEWSSTNSRTASSVGHGLFQAMAPGRARACARVQGRESCADVEVSP